MRCDIRVNIASLAAQITGVFVAIALALFVPAGTIRWPAGWLFLILFFGFVAFLSAWLLRNNPALLQERMRGPMQEGQKPWDRIFLVIAVIGFFGWLKLMAADAIRFRWSHLPVWLAPPGALLLLASFYLFFLTFRENAYLSPVVRIQEDRGQTVVTTGPYAYVRHPMYAAFTLFVLGAPLLLGSAYGLIGSLILILLVARRAALEERMLREELPGYDSYMAQVPWRLIPRVW